MIPGAPPGKTAYLGGITHCTSSYNPNAVTGHGVICDTRALPGAVIPAKAGIYPQATGWIPACAVMTGVHDGIGCCPGSFMQAIGVLKATS